MRLLEHDRMRSMSCPNGDLEFERHAACIVKFDGLRKKNEAQKKTLQELQAKHVKTLAENRKP